MSRVFVDTSALFALLVPSDGSHRKAKRVFASLKAGSAVLVTSSYVLVETYALLGRRFGWKAIQAFREEFVPLLEIVWVSQDLHDQGLDLLLDRQQARLSLVDAVSFLVVRNQSVDRVFAYDRHFQKEDLPVIE